MKIVFIYPNRQPQMVEVNNRLYALEITLGVTSEPIVHEVDVHGETTKLDLRYAVKGWIPE